MRAERQNNDDGGSNCRDDVDEEKTKTHSIDDRKGGLSGKAGSLTGAPLSVQKEALCWNYLLTLTALRARSTHGPECDSSGRVLSLSFSPFISPFSDSRAQGLNSKRSDDDHNRDDHNAISVSFARPFVVKVFAHAASFDGDTDSSSSLSPSYIAHSVPQPLRAEPLTEFNTSLIFVIQLEISYIVFQCLYQFKHERFQVILD